MYLNGSNFKVEHLGQDSDFKISPKVCDGRVSREERIKSILSDKDQFILGGLRKFDLSLPIDKSNISIYQKQNIQSEELQDQSEIKQKEDLEKAHELAMQIKTSEIVEVAEDEIKLAK